MVKTIRKMKEYFRPPQNKQLEITRYIKWRCPLCDVEYQDPAYTVMTCCNEGHLVLLEDLESDGFKDAEVVNK